VERANERTRELPRTRAPSCVGRAVPVSAQLLRSPSRAVLISSPAAPSGPPGRPQSLPRHVRYPARPPDDASRPLSMACAFPGKPEFYGLGIRVAFYLLWFAAIIASWVARPVVPQIRMVLTLFVAAVFLATVLATGSSQLQTIEIYLLTLLFYGAYYAYIPLYLWRLASGCSPFWNPYGWRRIEPSRAWSLANFLLLVATTSFQLWFWTTGINVEPNRDDDGCPEWGFFFAPVLLRNPLFIALNIVITVVILVCSVVHLMFDVNMIQPPRWLRKKNRKARKRRIR
jgi:hypothetical protein